MKKHIPLLDLSRFLIGRRQDLSEYIGRKISYVNITEHDARKLIKDMGMND